MELGEEKEKDTRLSNNINCLMLERCYVDLVELGNCKRSARSVEESYCSFNSVKDLFLPARGSYQDFQEYRRELVLMIRITSILYLLEIIMLRKTETHKKDVWKLCGRFRAKRIKTYPRGFLITISKYF
jgi:hypothetical protein